MIELSTIRDLVAIFGVIAGFTYYVLTVQNTRKNQQQQLETRQAQLFMSIYQNWASKDNLKDLEKWIAMEWTDYDDFFTRYSPQTTPDEHASWDKMIYYFEGLGLLVKQELVNPISVSELLGAAIIFLWEKYSPLLIEMRERVQMPDQWSNFEYLYNKMNKLRPERPEHIKPR